MSLEHLAPELLVQILYSLHTISDVLNLTQTCKRLRNLFRAMRRLPTLFAAAEREFGPVDDIIRLVTWHRSQPVFGFPDASPVTVTQNVGLLRQVLEIGRTAKKIEELYPVRRWGEDRYLERRSLTSEESFRVRRAVYRYWLFCEAFQNKLHTRGTRSLPGVVEERSKMLRGWGSDELSEIEDIRLILEDLISTDLCPTDSMVRKWFHNRCDFSDVRWQQQRLTSFQRQLTHLQQGCNWSSWPPDRYRPYAPAHLVPSSYFHSHRDDSQAQSRADVPVPQRRKMEMCGWGDDISQYYVVQSMLKLNPAQLMYLYENVWLKEGIEGYIDGEIGGEWFWDNGQTWTDTWALVLARRGWDLELVEAAIDKGLAGIVGRGLGKLGTSLGDEIDHNGPEEDGNRIMVCT